MKTVHITSRDNARVKHLAKLLDARDYRYEHGQYVLEGIRALDGLKTVTELFVREGKAVPAVVAETVYILAPHVFDAVAATEHSQGVMAVCGMPASGSAVDPAKRYILLDRIQDPGNMGTMLRTACAFGFDGVLLTKGCTDPFSPKVVRSAMGAEHQIAVLPLLSLAPLAGCAVIAADMHGLSLIDFHWPDGFVLCIGSEAHGIAPDVRRLSQCSVAIPMHTTMESLNAAVAAGILAFAATRGGR